MASHGLYISIHRGIDVKLFLGTNEAWMHRQAPVRHVNNQLMSQGASFVSSSRTPNHGFPRHVSTFALPQ